MSQMMRAVFFASQTTFFSTALYSAAALPLAMTRERNVSRNCPSAPSRLGITASNSKLEPSALKLRDVVIEHECSTLTARDNRLISPGIPEPAGSEDLLSSDFYS